MAKKISGDKKELFESMPIPRALATLAIPTVISQLINVIYNMVDAFFIGRTGNSYMMAATSLSLPVMLITATFAHLFGVGGGSLVSRLMGEKRGEDARSVSAFSFYGAGVIAILYSLIIWLFMDPIFAFLGASDATMPFVRQYVTYVVVIGCIFSTMSHTLAFLLRNTGFSGKASFGLSGGGVLNMALDPLFMFVILPPGMEVVGAAVATMLSNACATVYLFIQVRKAAGSAPLSLSLREAKTIGKDNTKKLFAVGIPASVLLLLYDVSNACVNRLASAHSDQVLAAFGIVMKIERIPNAICIGIALGMLPILAYNFASGNHERMKKTMRFARIVGFAITGCFIILLEIFAKPVTNFFLSTAKGDTAASVLTVTLAAGFLRIRCLASPMQFINYSSSYSMQAMGNGRGTMIHSVVRQLVFYVPFMFILDRLFGESGLAAALPVAETCGAAVALILVARTIKKAQL